MVIGANGMLGGSVFRYLSKNPRFQVLGTVRSQMAKDALNRQGFDNIISNIDVTDLSAVVPIISEFKPNYVVNCVGVIKQLNKSKSPISVRLNSLLPHQLLRSVNKVVKLIHFSTIYFSGKEGGYLESDVPDAADLYGRSKLLGEVMGASYPSDIYHWPELSSTHSLVVGFV